MGPARSEREAVHSNTDVIPIHRSSTCEHVHESSPTLLSSLAQSVSLPAPSRIIAVSLPQLDASTHSPDQDPYVFVSFSAIACYSIVPTRPDYTMTEPSSDNLVLSVNAGSSSLKISLFRVLSSEPTPEPVELILESNSLSLTSPPATFSFVLAPTSKSDSQPPASSAVDSSEIPAEDISDHKSAFAFFLKHLHEQAGYAEGSIKKVCHRVVHGGDYRAPEIINKESYDHLEKLSDLAPL